VTVAVAFMSILTKMLKDGHFDKKITRVAIFVRALMDVMVTVTL
jgi:hypothetical protein